MAVSDARAVVAESPRAFIEANDGTAVVITHTAEGFHVDTEGDPTGWPDRVLHILSNHG
jgi:hypothetical protein